MRLLFVGGTGRLSQDVVSEALANGHDVYTLTRGIRPYEMDCGGTHTAIKADIRDQDACRNALGTLTFDVVIDFLSYRPEQLGGTLDVLRGRFSQYVFISSATVYEKDGSNELITESGTPIGNEEWSYSANKVLCEKSLVARQTQEADWEYTIVRPYVTYGRTRIPYPIVPRDTTAEWTLLARIEAGLPIITCDLSNKTTLTHTKDFARGVVGLFGNPAAYGEAFHITSGEEHSWNDVIDILNANLRKPTNNLMLSQGGLTELLPEYRDILVGDKGRNMVFDNTKIKKAVPGFKCEITLEQGLADTIAYLESHPEAQKTDSLWNGRMDWVCGKRGMKVSSLSLCTSLKGRTKYIVGRVPFLLRLFRKGI